MLGALNDHAASEALYVRLRSLSGRGQVLGDSGFQRAGSDPVAAAHIVTPNQLGGGNPGHAPETDTAVLAVGQMVQWNLSSLMNMWRRLTQRLPLDAQYRNAIITVVALLHNFRIRYTGHVEMQTVMLQSTDMTVDEVVRWR